MLFSYQEQLDECLDEIIAYGSAKDAIYEFGRRFLLKEVDDPDYMDRNPLYQDFGQTYFGPLFEKGMKSGEFKQGDPKLYGDIYWHYLLGSILETADARRYSKETQDLKQVLSLFEK